MYVYLEALGGWRGKGKMDHPSQKTYLPIQRSAITPTTRWANPSAKAWNNYSTSATPGVRDYVLGSSVVAVSSANRGGLSARTR
ncbi:MAG: hypothetical protein CBARDCOR_4262 [uncultured Caballeronia sp.]|nr:MAG: hypothetical protein CBARDCOR_4262 [uncultured Caballeronia sp.]